MGLFSKKTKSPKRGKDEGSGKKKGGKKDGGRAAKAQRENIFAQKLDMTEGRTC